MLLSVGAGEGNRTLVISLEGCCTAKSAFLKKIADHFAENLRGSYAAVTLIVLLRHPRVGVTENGARKAWERAAISCRARCRSCTEQVGRNIHTDRLPRDLGNQRSKILAGVRLAGS